MTCEIFCEFVERMRVVFLDIFSSTSFFFAIKFRNKKTVFTSFLSNPILSFIVKTNHLFERQSCKAQHEVDADKEILSSGSYH